MDEAADGNHGQARVLDLGELIPPARKWRLRDVFREDTCSGRFRGGGEEKRARRPKHQKGVDSRRVIPEGGLVSGEVERVKAEVARSAAVSEHGALQRDVSFYRPDRGNFTSHRGDLSVVGKDLESAEEKENLPESASRHREESLGGELVVEARARKLDLLLDDEAEGGKHRNASVLQLSLAQPLDIEIVREAERVKANIASQGTIQPGRAGEERHGDRLVLHAQT